MTESQKILKRFVEQYYGINTITGYSGMDRINILDSVGKTTILTLNLYGDIIDDQNKIIAESDLPHDITMLGCQVPKHWILK